MSAWGAGTNLAAKLKADKEKVPAASSNEEASRLEEPKPSTTSSKGNDTEKKGTAKGGKKENGQRDAQKSKETEKKPPVKPKDSKESEVTKPGTTGKTTDVKKPETPTSNRPAASDPVVPASSERDHDPAQPLVSLPAEIQAKVNPKMVLFSGQSPQAPVSSKNESEIPPEMNAAATAPLGAGTGSQQYNPPSYNDYGGNSGYGAGYGANFNNGWNQGYGYSGYANAGSGYSRGGTRHYNYYQQGGGYTPQYGSGRGGYGRGYYNPHNPPTHYGYDPRQQQGYDQQQQQQQE